MRFGLPRTGVVRRVLGAMLLFVLFSSATEAASSLTLAWDPNNQSDLAGYIVFYGTTSGNYSNSSDVGNKTTFTATNLVAGQTYYFAVLAYNSAGVRSPLSQEVSATTAPPAAAVVTVTPSTSSMAIGGSANLVAQASRRRRQCGARNCLHVDDGQRQRCEAERVDQRYQHGDRRRRWLDDGDGFRRRSGGYRNDHGERIGGSNRGDAVDGEHEGGRNGESHRAGLRRCEQSAVERVAHLDNRERLDRQPDDDERRDDSRQCRRRRRDSVTVRAGSISAASAITVTAAPTVNHVTITPGTSNLVSGQSQQFVAIAYDSTNAPIQGVPFTWTTSNSAVAALGTTTGATVSVTAQSAAPQR